MRKEGFVNPLTIEERLTLLEHEASRARRGRRVMAHRMERFRGVSSVVWDLPALLRAVQGVPELRAVSSVVGWAAERVAANLYGAPAAGCSTGTLAEDGGPTHSELEFAGQLTLPVTL